MANVWTRELKLISATTGQHGVTTTGLKLLYLFLEKILGYTFGGELSQAPSGSGGWIAFTGPSTCILSGVAGLPNAPDNPCGRMISISGNIIPGNNGTFRILSSGGTQVIYTNPSGAGGAHAGGWSISAASFRTTEFSGANGALSNANKNFVDATFGAFDAGYAGKSIVIASTTGWNGGVFKILSFVDANTVTIDTRTAVGEFPTTQTGLSWWVLADEYDRPNISGDWVRAQSPAGWGIELKLNTVNYYSVWEVSISPNNVWSGPTAKVIGPVWFGHGGFNYWETVPTNWNLYFLGNTEGTFLHMWIENANGGNWIVSIGSIVPVEAVHSADELMLLTGPIMTFGANDNSKASVWATRDTTTYGCLGNGFVWTEPKRIKRQVWAMENGYAGVGSGFSKKGGEINQRTGKNDLMIGTLYMLDWGNTAEEYEYLGFVNHHLSGRSNLARRSAMDVDSNKDKYHISDGIVVEWPGVTPQF